MMEPVGTIFAEVDLDWIPYTRSQKRLLKDATSTTLNIEKSYKDLGIRSAKEFDLMRAKVHNAYNRITKDAKTSAQDIVRAERAKADQLKRINEEQFGRQTSLLEKLRSNWIALGGAIYTAQRIMRSAITAASDLQETQNKFNVVFRDQIVQAEKWSAVLVDGYAMSTREAKQYMASIQDLLKPMGMQSDAAAKMSFEVTKLAADIGSFNNQPTAKVMADIQSALVGNYETMKKYGVVLNETVVKEKALAMGLADTKDQLNANHKAQAAYALIVAGSADAVGDLARSQGTYATTMKQYKAAVEDLMAAIGQHLLPVMTKFVSLLSDAARFWGHVFGTTENSVLEKQRDVILGQIRTMEHYKKAGPLMIEFIYGSEEEWAAKKRALELELQDIGRKLNAPKVVTGTAAGGGGAALPPIISGAGGPGTSALPKDIKYTSVYYGRPMEEEIRYSKMWRTYQGYLDNQVKSEKDAAAERLKIYKKLGEDEEKIWNAKIQDYKEHTQEMSRTVRDFAQNANWTLSEVFFDTMSRDMKSFGDYWDAFWERMKNSLARTFADMATDWAMGGMKNILMGGSGGGGLFGSLLGGAGSWLGGATKSLIGGIGSVLGKIFHEGGIVGDIAGMKAFHDLRHDEVVGILQKGEMVLTRDQAATLSRLMGGGGIGHPGVVGPVGAQMSMGQFMGTIGNLALGMATGGLTTVAKGVANVISQELFGQSAWGAITSPISFADQMGITQGGGYAQAWGGDIGGTSGGMSLGDAMDALGAMGSYGGLSMRYGGLARGPESGYEARLHGTEMVVSQKRGVPARVESSRTPMRVTVPVYIDGAMVSEKVYEGVYDASRNKRITLHERGLEGYTKTVGLDI